jgi:hypothetical protein
MKKHLQIIFPCLIFVLYSTKIIAQHTHDHKYVLLKDAIQYQDTLKLEQFFSDWYSESKSLIVNNYKELPEIKRNVYSLFIRFYFPKGLSERDIPDELKGKYTNPDTIEALFLPYKKPECIVIQNRIYFGVVKNFFKLLDETEFEVDKMLIYSDSITNFGPPIEIRNKKTLYLIEKYENILDSLLMQDVEDSLMKGEINQEYYDKICLEIDRRLEFLKPKVAIIPGHWGGIHILTMPIIHIIVFERSIHWAKILYRDSWWTGAEAYYIRIGNSWLKIIQRRTWAE